MTSGLPIRSRPRLAVIGASVRAAVQSAVRGGYACHAFDLFADADLAAACPVSRIEAFDDRLLEPLADDRIDAWLYSGGMEHYPELIKQMANVKPLLGCSGASLAQVRDPYWLADCLAAAGLAFPPLRTAPPIEVGKTWLVKKRTSCGGLGVQRFKSPTAAGEASDSLYYQQMIPGQPISAMYLATAERCYLLAAFEQWVGLPWTGVPGEFMYCGALGPLEFNEPVMSQLESIGALLAEAAGMRGLFGIDAILSDDQVTLVEVNPRYTASMELWDRSYKLEAQASGFESACQSSGVELSKRNPLACVSSLYSAIDLHFRACHEVPLSVGSLERSALQAKAIVYAREAMRIGAEFEALVGEWNQGELPTVADIPSTGQVIQPGEPICTVFERGEDREDIISSLRRRVDEVYSRGMRF